MLYGDYELYSKAINSHIEHNERWGYEMYIQRQNMLGGGGFMNKPSYLLSLIIAELGKKEEDRIDWFMWVDADLILINPSIPLSIFLPPSTSSPPIPPPNFIGNKDHNGLNTGTFFLRVHPWSVHFLIQTLSFSAFNPSIDPGNSIDQYAMAAILNTTSPDPMLALESTEIGWDGSGGTEEQRSAMRVGGSNGEVLFQPRLWYNAYEWHHGFEGREGSLLVHFPGLEDDRWEHMRKWFTELEHRQEKWDVSLEKTFYGKEVPDYWNSVAEGHTVFDDGLKWFFNNPYVEDGGGQGAKGKEQRQRLAEKSVDELSFCLRHASDDVYSLKRATQNVLKLMQSERSGKGRSRAGKQRA